MEFTLASPEKQRPLALVRSNTAQPSASGGAQLFSPTASSASSGPRKSHFLHHHHHHSSNHRHRNPKDVVSSAIQLHPPSSLSDLLGKPSRSGTPSRDPSAYGERRRPTTPPDADDYDGISPKFVRPEDVSIARMKARQREGELQSFLQNLSDQSLDTSRRLDDTYYSVLEKFASLRTVISELQELSESTKELQESFDSHVIAVQEDIQGQINSFGGFDEQAAHLEKLEARMVSGKTRVESLNARLEDARRRVDAREKTDVQWQSRTSRRLKVLWGVLGTIGILCIILFLIHYVGGATSERAATNATVRDRLDLDQVSVPPDIKDILKSANSPSPSSTCSKLPAFPSSEAAKPMESIFKILDEL